MFFLPCLGPLTLMATQTQTAMEEMNIGNVRAVLETGKLNNIVPEQADML
jgi:glyoxylate reductase